MEAYEDPCTALSVPVHDRRLSVPRITQALFESRHALRFDHKDASQCRSSGSKSLCRFEDCSDQRDELRFHTQVTWAPSRNTGGVVDDRRTRGAAAADSDTEPLDVSTNSAPARVARIFSESVALRQSRIEQPPTAGNVSNRNRSVGRGASSSCARTAMRRACALLSRCTDTRLCAEPPQDAEPERRAVRIRGEAKSRQKESRCASSRQGSMRRSTTSSAQR